MRDKNFTVPPYDKTPRSIAQDTRLSAEALGVLIYLRSLPWKDKGSSKDWEISVSHLRSVWSWGKDRAQRILGELVELEYLELVKGGAGGGSGYRLRELVEDEMIRQFSTERRARSPTSESRETRPSSESRKTPTSGKPGRGKTRLSNIDNYIQTDNEINMMKDRTRDSTSFELSFLKQESDLFYRDEIIRVLTELPDPVVIWINQAGRSTMGAAPFSTISGLAQKYGLEIYAAGVVIGANDSSRPRISIRFCAAIMERLAKQSRPDRGPEKPISGNGLGSALPEDL